MLQVGHGILVSDNWIINSLPLPMKSRIIGVPGGLVVWIHSDNDSTNSGIGNHLSWLIRHIYVSILMSR